MKHRRSFDDPLRFYFFPKSARIIMLPSFRSTPARVVGIPVFRAKFCFARVIPNALFHENDRPGDSCISPFLYHILIILSTDAIFPSISAKFPKRPHPRR